MRATSSKPASDSATLRFTFLRLWLSEAETKTTISSTPASAARSAPFAFGTRAASTVPRLRSRPPSTSSTSTSCGTARGETKEENSMRGIPAWITALISRILVSVGTNSASA